jgi:O-acetyl-ADP-ribose deacetylase (regulator of RNase III)
MGHEPTGRSIPRRQPALVRTPEEGYARPVGARIELLHGDITTQDVDAIVNAANTALRPGGGVDGAITRAAGPEALADRTRVIAERGSPPLPTGDAVATVGGALAARWIIHTAGPIYRGTEQDRAALAACHRAALRVADELGARTVAFPAISTGIYSYPVEEAAPIAIASVSSATTAVAVVRFVLFDVATFDAFEHALGT